MTEAERREGHSVFAGAPTPGMDWAPASATFSKFLQCTEADTLVLRRHREVLLDDSEAFAREFYDYLTMFPETSDVLERYRRTHGSLDGLIAKQLEHLHELLDGDFGPESYARLIELGGMHFLRGVAPVWIHGSYLIYHRHLRHRAMFAPGIEESERERLLQAIERVIFRDAGVMTEGYWLFAQDELGRRQTQVNSLQQRVTGLLSNIPLTLWSVTVPEHKLLFVSPHGEGTLPPLPALPVPYGDRVLPQYRAAVEDAWARASKGDTVSIDAEVLDLHGPRSWLRYTLCPHPPGSPRPERLDGIMEDLTEVKELGNRLLETQSSDRVTGLPNRTLLLDRLEQAIQIGERRSERELLEVALVLLDLDQFGQVNENYGYGVGDDLLADVAARLSKALRTSDSLARIGADEFAILLPDAPEGVAEARVIIDSVMRCFQHTFQCRGHEIYIRPAIGVAIWPTAGADAAAILSKAEAALTASKKNDLKPQFYRNGVAPRKGRVLEITTELHHALDRDEIVLHYQPIVEIGTSRVVGAEVLIRWDHPRLGLLLPGDFLGLAERSGAIRPLTEWTVTEAMRQGREWAREGLEVRVCCNVSPRSLHDQRIVDGIRLALIEAGDAKNILELEVTEESLISTPERVRTILQDFTALGAVIAIDDFGTGYSSLSYLRTLPVSTLKIDQSIVRDINDDRAAMAIVASTVDLAHSLGYSVVAEGVESQAVLDKLFELGCERAQGFHVGMPMPAADFRAWLSASPYTVARPSTSGLTLTA